MAKCIVTATNKGGDGKTTLGDNIAQYLSIIKNLRGLIIDLDPQCNITSRYLKVDYDPAFEGGKMPPKHPSFDPNTNTEPNWDGRSSIADIFYGKGVDPYPTFISNLEIAPGYASKLTEAEAVTKEEVIEKVHSRVKMFINLPEVQERYDFILIDTPPSKGPLTIAAFKAASHIIIPAQMEKYSIDGIYGMLQIWKQESYKRAGNDQIELVGILPNQLRDVKLHIDLLESLKEAKGIGNYVIPYQLKKRTVYSEILLGNKNQPKTVFDLPKNHVARLEMEEICKYLYTRIFKDGN